MQRLRRNVHSRPKRCVLSLFFPLLFFSFFFFSFSFLSFGLKAIIEPQSLHMRHLCRTTWKRTVCERTPFIDFHAVCELIVSTCVAVVCKTRSMYNKPDRSVSTARRMTRFSPLGLFVCHPLSTSQFLCLFVCPSLWKRRERRSFFLHRAGGHFRIWTGYLWDGEREDKTRL